MQIRNIAIYSKKKHFAVGFFLFIFSLIFLPFLSVHAGSNPDPATLNRLVQESDCPDMIKNTFAEISAKSTDVSVFTGTYYTARDVNTGEIFGISCSNAMKIQKILIRFVVILISLVGAILAFALGKSAILMITSFADPEKFQKAVASLRTAIIATIAVFFSYLTIVFIFVGLLGVGRVNGSSHPEWNVFCQNRIVFTITFTQGDDPCQS